MWNVPPIEYLINKEMCILTTLGLEISAKTHWERVLVVLTSLRQEKGVFFFPSWCMNIPISQVLWYLFLTIILEGINTKFHNLQHQKAFTSSWAIKRGLCGELIGAWRSTKSNHVSQARGFTFGELGASGYRAFYKLRSIVSVTYLLVCRTCNIITYLFDCC